MPADLAEVTYTSGSSADPKGVVHTHATVLRGTYWFGAARGAEDDGVETKILCIFPFFWIGGTLILGAAIQDGITVLCIERFEPGAALDIVEAEQATMVTGWPTLMQSMRDHPSFPDRKLPEIPGLTSGPSDIALTATPVPGIPGHRGMSETIGNFMGVETICVDPDTGEAKPDMEEGELWIRGHGVMHGYYKKEREEVFDENGWLHTGDRVFMHEGRPYFVGRYTEMVKSQGATSRRVRWSSSSRRSTRCSTRSSSGCRTPSVRKRSLRCSSPRSDTRSILADIQKRAREQISGYKVPTRIDIWSEDDVPWLGSGKPDKIAIRSRLSESESESTSA